MVAFSGGVDSTFLLCAVQESGIPYLAVTATSPTMPSQDLQQVKESVAILKANHRFIESGELQDDRFVANPPDRCFYCKSDLYQRLREVARVENYQVVVDGNNDDDAYDHRPGLLAREAFRIESPLMTVKLGKEEIRRLSREKGLKTWDRPASPCLSSRIAYGEPVDLESLTMVERGETTLRSLGFSVLRVRKQGKTARIELPLAEMPRLLIEENRLLVVQRFRKIGFECISLDLEGFISGKLNRAISSV